MCQSLSLLACLQVGCRACYQIYNKLGNVHGALPEWQFECATHFVLEHALMQVIAKFCMCEVAMHAGM